MIKFLIRFSAPFRIYFKSKVQGGSLDKPGSTRSDPPPSRSHRPDFPGEVLDHPPGSQTFAADLSTTPGVVSPPRFESISNPRCRGVARTSWRHRGSTGNDTPPQEESTRRLLRTSGRPPPEKPKSTEIKKTLPTERMPAHANLKKVACSTKTGSACQHSFFLNKTIGRMRAQT